MQSPFSIQPSTPVESRVFQKSNTRNKAEGAVPFIKQLSMHISLQPHFWGLQPN